MAQRRNLVLGMVIGASIMGTACLELPRSPAPTRTISIGVVAPFSTSPGEGIRRGAAMAVSEINAAGGVNGAQIRLVEFDDQFSVTKGVEGYQWLAGAQHVSAVVGYAGGGAFAALEQLPRYGVPIVCTGVGADRLTDLVRENPARYGRLFRVMHRSSELAEVTASYIREFLIGQLHLTRFAIMVEDDVWTKSLQDRWRTAIRDAGAVVVYEDQFSSQTTDFAAILSRARAAGSEYILDASSRVPSALYLKRWAELKGPLIGAVPTGAGTKTYYDEIGPAGTGVSTVGTIPSEQNPLTERAAVWHRKYMERYGDPEYTSAYSYDAVYLVVDAISRAGSTEPAELVAALERADLRGVVGRYQFGPDHHPRFGEGFRIINMLHAQAPSPDGYRVVWPRERATAEYMLPSWYVGRARAAR